MNDLILEILISFFLKNPLFWFYIIVIIICVGFYKKIVGKAGEFWVKSEIKKLSDEYKIINDVMLSVSDKTCQIDHIIVSLYGIFVIETKQYTGYLKGNDYDKSWIRYSSNKKHYIKNPIHQNYGHMKSLQQILNLSEDIFIPLVCISSRARVNIKSDKVVLIMNLLDKINSYKEIILPNYEEIYEFIKNNNIIDKKIRKEHIRSVKLIIKEKEKINKNKCPLCGNELVSRTSKYGDFIGCSNYPKCKYIKR